jgi:hypothetical protein
MGDDLIDNMRARVAQCRRLASQIGSEEARRVLLEMAEAGEADIRKLEEEAARPHED